MNRLRQFAHIAFTSLFVVVLTVSIFADTIKLKDGSTVKGTVISFVGGKFTIEIGRGNRIRQLTFDAAEVESIEFEKIVTTVSTVPRNEPVIIETTNIPTQPASVIAASSVKPIELTLKVRGDNTSNGWANTGWIVKKGQKIRISGSGEISLGKGKTSTPGGLWDLEDETKLLKAVPTGALIAVIGDDNNEFIYIGNEREFTASRDGALFLGVNEGNLNDNTGTYDVKVEIFP